MRLLALALALTAAAAVNLADEPAKTPAKTGDLEEQLLELVNNERAKEKAQALASNAVLGDMARAYAKKMADKDELSHSLDVRPGERADRVGYDYRKIYEIIARSDAKFPEPLTPALTGAATAEHVARTNKESLGLIVQGWLDSPPHKKALLDPDFTETGIGIVRREKGKVYFTQMFGVQRKK